MQSSSRIYRRRSTSAKEGAEFKKDNKQEHAFFGASSNETFFKSANAIAPSQSIQRKCAECEKEDKKVHRMSDKKEDEKKLQKKDSGASNAGTANTSTYISSLNGKGNHLPKQANQFFSAIMGYDFSGVKIHTDKEASDSAKDVNAKAYTIGNNIVFNEGQYNAESVEGKKLLAHELVHVVQNDNNCLQGKVQRQFNFQTPTPQEKDPVEIVYNQETNTGDKRDKSMGLTTPTFNGNLLSKMSEYDLSGLFVLGVKGNAKDKGVECSPDISKVNANVSAEELIITQATKNKWTGIFSKYSDPASLCKKKKDIPVTLNDISAKNLYQTILTNENQHVNDLKTIISDINAFYAHISSFSVQGKNENECIANLLKKINKTDNPALGMAKEFASKWLASVQAWDLSRKHTIKKDIPPRIKKECSGIEFDLH